MARPLSATGDDDDDLVTRVGPLEIEWAKSLGYFGGVALGIACDIISPPIGIFIAAVPIVRLLKAPGRPWAIRVVADALEGAAKPVGGDFEATVRWAQPPVRATRKQRRGLKRAA
jgi:hypothetical protein